MSTPQAYRKAADYLKEAKSVPCKDCGQTFPWYVMDFDHVRGEKKFNLGTSKQAGFNRIVEEVAKCEVVCSNCHRIRTHARRQHAVFV